MSKHQLTYIYLVAEEGNGGTYVLFQRGAKLRDYSLSELSPTSFGRVQQFKNSRVPDYIQVTEGSIELVYKLEVAPECPVCTMPYDEQNRCACMSGYIDSLKVREELYNESL